MNKVTFKSCGKLLHGTIMTPSDKKKQYPAILFIIGWFSQQGRHVQYLKALSKAGYVCMIFDIAGHGLSDGNINQISRKECVQNCVDAYDFLVSQQNVDTKKISVVGGSFGGYLASILVSKRDVGNLVLTAPQNYPNKGYVRPKVEMQGSMLNDWRNTKKDSKESYSLEGVHSFKGRVLLIQHEFDSYVSDTTIENYKQAINRENLTYVYFEGFPHSLKKQRHRKKYENTLIDWFGVSL